MPKIIGMDERQQALKEITNKLKDVSAINDFLKTSNETGEYTILFTDSNGKKVRADIHCDSKEDVNLLVEEYKQNIKHKIIELAQAQQIGFDDDEKELLGLEY